MKKNTRLKIVVFLLSVVLLLQSCNLPGSSAGDDLTAEQRAQTMVAETLAASGEDGGAGTGGNGESPDPTLTTAPSPTATETLVPTITLTATITLTPTLSTPMVSVSVDTNCRTGPGKIYDYIGALLVGEAAEVVGQSMDGQYWIIKNPDQAGECWLWGNYATVKGPIAGLPKYTPPPTPTPVFFWEGSWTVYTGDPGGPYLTDSMSVVVNGKNLTATIDMGGGNFVNITGTISDDYLSVTGSYTTSGMTGTIEWFAQGMNQFIGNGKHDTIPSDFAWCGARGGAGQPSPCYQN